MTASRLVLVITLTIGLLAAPLAAEAQLAGKVYRVGFLFEALRIADLLRPQTARSPKR